jgi:hypothetical protein
MNGAHSKDCPLGHGACQPEPRQPYKHYNNCMIRNKKKKKKEKQTKRETKTIRIVIVEMEEWVNEKGGEGERNGMGCFILRLY